MKNKIWKIILIVGLVLSPLLLIITLSLLLAPEVPEFAELAVFKVPPDVNITQLD